MMTVDGVQVGLAVGESGDPLVSLHFLVDGDTNEFVFTEQQLAMLIGLAHEGQVRAAVMREMLTMFPEQADDILANLYFRWVGIDGSDS